MACVPAWAWRRAPSVVTVQPLGLGEHDLQRALDAVQGQRALGAASAARRRWRCRAARWQMAARMSPQLIFAFSEDRPVLLAAQYGGSDTASVEPCRKPPSRT
jgi:hypothetical protein